MTLLLLVLLLGAAPLDAVTIPAGPFSRGSTRAPDEQPVREIQLSAYRIDRTEVTVADYEAFLREGYRLQSAWSEAGWAWRAQHGAVPAMNRSGRQAAHPVVAVSWFEAAAYCRWRGGALPTEAQWERAACGGQPGPYPWGTQTTRPARWTTRMHPTDTLTVATAPVGEDPLPSPTGLKHAAGNVWEWTADWYHREAYQSGSGTDPQGPAGGTWRTLRGGSFANLPSYCTCTHREPAAPDQRRLTAGFRCAYSVP